jgi:hypothetical protein
MEISNPRYNTKQLRALGWLLLVLLIGSANGVAQSVSEVRVIEESAISYTRFLSKARFDQRFPGQIKAGTADLYSGWYVIYKHESLSYYFGPILLESTGQDYLEQLTQTVEAAVQQRPSITDYRLELSFEPSEASSTEGAESSGSSAESEGNDGSPPPPPPPPPPSFDIWSLVRSVFGF